MYIVYHISQLETHIKKLTVKELKHEVALVKKEFQVSKMKRADVVDVITDNPTISTFT